MRIECSSSDLITNFPRICFKILRLCQQLVCTVDDLSSWCNNNALILTRQISDEIPKLFSNCSSSICCVWGTLWDFYANATIFFREQWMKLYTHQFVSSAIKWNIMNGTSGNKSLKSCHCSIRNESRRIKTTQREMELPSWIHC